MLGALLLAAVLQENVATRIDPAQTYTLILPSSYDPATKHPLLLIFDPRGRGTLAANIFKDAAEDHGWIIISSNGTRSDVGPEPNKAALRAVIPDAMERYAVDPKRVYATGFSGTAMLAWSFGVHSEMLAGVIGVGGRLVDEIPPRTFNFAHYGFAGDTDFNNREMRAVDALLDKIPHRFESFPGEHRWIPASLGRDAIVWMELIAMKEGRRTRDPKLIADAYARDVATAAALPGRESLRRYQAIVRTFDGMHPIDDAKAAVARLESDAGVRRELEAEAKWDAFEAKFIAEVLPRIGNIAASLRAQDPDNMIVARSRFMREYRVVEMKKRATRDDAEGRTARRILVAIHAQMAYDLPRQFESRGERAFADAARAVAAEIRK